MPDEIKVRTAFGDLIAVPGGEPDRFPEIILKLRRSDGQEMILAAASDLSKDEPDTLRVGMYSSAYARDMDIKVRMNSADINSPAAQFYPRDERSAHGTK